MANNQKSDFQAPVVYEPPEAVLARLGFVDDVSRAFVFAEAAIMKIDPGLLDIPENIAEVVKAAEYTRKYGLQPGIHLHMQGPFNTEVTRKLPDGNSVKVWEKRLALVVGEQAYKTSGRIQAQAEGDFIDWEWEPLSPAETKAYVAENFPKSFVSTDDDRVVRARLLSLKSAELARAMGKKYDPPWVYAGVFFKGVPNRDGKFPKSDSGRVPNQRTALDKAVQRAIKKATMQKYGLVPLDNRTEEQRMRDVMRKTEEQPHDSWMSARDAQGRDYSDLGDTFPADDDIIDVEFAAMPPEPPPADEPEPDDAGADILSDPNVHDVVKEFVQALRQKDAHSARKATEKQHRFAVGVIDGITGKDTHRMVFSAIFNRDVTGDHPLAEEAAQLLFSWLCQKKSARSEAGKWIKVDNPHYDPTMVEFVGVVHKWALANLAEEEAELAAA